jgi:hypothetical protein
MQRGLTHFLRMLLLLIVQQDVDYCLPVVIIVNQSFEWATVSTWLSRLLMIAGEF